VFVFVTVNCLLVISYVVFYGRSLAYVTIFKSPVHQYPADTGEKWEYNGTIYQLVIDFKKAYYSVRRKLLYNILIEFGRPRKPAGLIKTRLNETCSTVRTGISV
jgi:hypothetical protein